MAKILQSIALLFLGIIGVSQLLGCATVPTEADNRFAEVEQALNADASLFFSEDGDLTEYGFEVFFDTPARGGLPLWRNMAPAAKVTYLESSGKVVMRAIWTLGRNDAVKTLITDGKPDASDVVVTRQLLAYFGDTAVAECITERQAPVDICVFSFARVADFKTLLEASHRIDEYRKTVAFRERGSTAVQNMMRRSFQSPSVPRPMTKSH
jgi:hypothetical protein